MIKNKLIIKKSLTSQRIRVVKFDKNSTKGGGLQSRYSRVQIPPLALIIKLLDLNSC
jgi:hypothetical protein